MDRDDPMDINIADLSTTKKRDNVSNENTRRNESNSIVEPMETEAPEATQTKALEAAQLLAKHKEAVMHISASTSVFEEVIQSPIFVDKSKVISTIMNPKNYIYLVTAPRRFGKSSIAEMLRSFFTLEVTKRGKPISKPLKELYENEFDHDGKPVDKDEKVIENGKTKQELEDEPVTDTPNYKMFTSPIPGILRQTGVEHCLKICEDTSIMNKHFGKYPMVYVNLICCDENAVLKSLQRAISECYQQHKYLQFSTSVSDSDKEWCKKWCSLAGRYEFDKTETQGALTDLTRLLHFHFKKKCFVIVDEIDAIGMSCLFKLPKAEFGTALDDVTNMMDNFVKSNPHISSAFLTGISQIITAGIGKFNNVVSRRFLQNEEFFDYYGFTEAEVKDVIGRFELLKDSFEIVEKYYNGYRLASDPKRTIFNTYSIMYYIIERIEGNYWSTSGPVSKLNDMLHKSNVKEPLNMLLLEDNCSFEVDYQKKLNTDDVFKLFDVLNGKFALVDPSLYFCFLYEQGYFTVSICKDSTRLTKALLSIPNMEIRILFRKYLNGYFEAIGLDFGKVDNCACLFDKMDFRDEQNAKKVLREICCKVRETFTLIKAKNEAEFHHIMYVILKRTTGFKCRSEKTICNGKRPDLIAFQKGDDEISGIIIELKFNGDGEYALDVLLERDYFKAFKTENKKYILIGMNINEDGVVTMCVLFNTRDKNMKMHFE